MSGDSGAGFYQAVSIVDASTLNADEIIEQFELDYFTAVEVANMTQEELEIFVKSELGLYVDRT